MTEPIVWLVTWSTKHTPYAASAYLTDLDARHAADNVRNYADAMDVAVIPAFAQALPPEDPGMLKSIVTLMDQIETLREALQALVDQVDDYQRLNRLAPTPPRTECWDTMAEAKRVLDAVGTPSND